ncbi:hypothetical protein GPECTOR_7g1261 [Gonium pectorale]|uniref:UspA domain-containing protein n=1 Tax=Gonium pectorale TaxID=33097 RepID=A0A150GU28_GONPE|nr:hypothetical protein GPECTOR_7g1261 [Gonium pectorale]|eukprot:KXZ53365.1 hypothetical protein GPECTOR_7g1261 [Gonium pectorale]
MDNPPRLALFDTTRRHQKASQRALEWVQEQLYREGDELHLFHVIPPAQHMMLSPYMGIEEIVEDDEPTRRRVEEAAHKMLIDHFTPLLKKKDAPFQLELTRFDTDNSSIGAVVCKRAEQLPAAVVVLSKHSRGAIKEFFVGSVCSYCVHHSKVPVLVMHGD